MMVNGKWIYWKEQCKYCSNSFSCVYKETVKDYINNLNSIVYPGIYGTLNWRCDYFVFDEKKYDKLNPGECNCEQ